MIVPVYLPYYVLTGAIDTIADIIGLVGVRLKLAPDPTSVRAVREPSTKPALGHIEGGGQIKLGQAVAAFARPG